VKLGAYPLDVCLDFVKQFLNDVTAIRGHLQTDFGMLNVIMMLRGGVQPMML